MLVLNKYLRELGINEDSWPFNEITENTRNKSIGKHYDKRYIEQDGFINAESFDMSYTLALIIYSYLCYFRDNCIEYGYPVHFKVNGSTMLEDPGHYKWRKTVDGMILGFKMYIEIDDKAPSILDYPNDYEKWKREFKKYNRKMNYGIRLFAKYFGSIAW